MRKTAKTEPDRLSALFGRLREEPADEVASARLARRVMGALGETGASAWSMGWRLRPSWSFAAAAAAIALVAIGLGLRGGWGPEPEHGSDVRIVNVHSNGGLYIEWADTGKSEYRVLKSTDPADFDRAEANQVRGTRYVDTARDAAQVVYYRVE